MNGWSLTYHVFDYNLDYFELGTLDDPAWKISDPKLRLIGRALAARGGLWGNHGYEAAYAMSYKDGGGAQLEGAHRYEMRFETTPPVGAFWSITMYDLPEFYLVENPIQRYSVGDRTPGLVRGDDGTLAITIQHDEPDAPEARANWLPAPSGRFRPILRMYEPDAAVFDGSYTLRHHPHRLTQRAQSLSPPIPSEPSGPAGASIAGGVVEGSSRKSAVGTKNRLPVTRRGEVEDPVVVARRVADEHVRRASARSRPGCAA